MAAEIGVLRGVLHETVDQYTARVDGRLAALLARLEGSEAGGDRPWVPAAGVSRALLDELRGLKLKPEKGRAKDLARIQKLVESLAMFPEGEA